jgi:cytochrome b pre-mRNA-processing protein 3
MIFTMFRHRASEATIRALYGAIVAQARNPSFYRDYGVPDTTTGRFEMIVLHQALVLRRLGGWRDDRSRLGQGLFDVFCRDMDGNLREMGVGDLAVPKEMRRMVEAFYGRVAAYDRALAGGAPALDGTPALDGALTPDAALVLVLARNVLGEGGSASQPAQRLARYVRRAVQQLAATTEASMAQATLAFPDPDAIIVPAAA